MQGYEIFSKDTLVAVWENKELKVINDSLLPLYLRRIKNADMWLETRAIDSHRANSRLLKKALRLKEKDDLSCVLHVNAATITDNYWIREIGSSLTYSDVRFSDDYFSELALTGSYNSFESASSSGRSKTPELTNVGSFEKCWKLKNGRWWMYKRANHSELFSELFIYELGVALGMNMAVYERGDGFIRSLDFTNSAEVNFEPASAFMGDNEDYCDVVEALYALCPEAIPDYVKMIFLDTVCANPDRHTNNFGLLRNIRTGAFVGLAPNFDNNMALISRGYPAYPKTSDILIKDLRRLIEKHPSFADYIPELTEDAVVGILAKLNMRVRTRDIVDLVLERYRLISL